MSDVMLPAILYISKVYNLHLLIFKFDYIFNNSISITVADHQATVQYQ